MSREKRSQPAGSLDAARIVQGANAARRDTLRDAMRAVLTGTAKTACAMFVCVMPVLSGCGGVGGAVFETSSDSYVVPSDGASSPPATAAGAGGLTAPAPPQPGPAAGRPEVLSDAQASGESAASAGPSPSTSAAVAGTTLGGRRLATPARDNPEAADLLDHWGHRHNHKTVDGLSLPVAAAGDNGSVLQTLRDTVQGRGEAQAVNLHDGDEVRVLGAHRGVTYGRWTGGPADTLSIDFNLSRAGPEMGSDPAFQALLERAGKAWSHRIADTWIAWERAAGEVKGSLLANGETGTDIRVGPGGETSTGLEIYLTAGNLPGDAAGRGTQSTAHSPGDSWEPHFGSVEIDREYLREAGEAELFATLAHEIGHVLGSWMGGAIAERYVSHTNRESGTWSGPNVVAVHGGPAPFQDVSEPLAWVNGERDPLATRFDFGHSGVCASLMAYCNKGAALPAFLPQAIDFAFLEDLGLTLTEPTDRPETYGLAGWTDYAAFTLSLSRDLQMALADPQPHYDGAVNPWHKLDVVDLLQIEVDAFGHRTTAAHAADLSGAARYAGGLIGAALDRAGLPPVTGNASLTLNLGTLDGTASFTSLRVHPGGFPETFAGGALHYSFGLSGNELAGSGPGLTLRADFYGPGHEEVAGILHDPRAALLASFGATTDERRSREAIAADAGHVAGTAYRRGSADAANDGWYDYRCTTGNGCESRHLVSGSWTAWEATTREGVLAATAGWDWRDAARPVEDRGFVRIARQTGASTDGRQGRHAADGYTGTLDHAVFGVGFEQYTSEWTDSAGTAAGFGTTWAGFQGDLSGSGPGGVARWSGLMLGYQGGHAAGENPFVQGLATVKFSLSDNQIEVLFSGVTSRDQERMLPDFGFDDLAAQADGTFQGGGQSGTMDGALFGTAHEEAAGAFHHNATHVTGSFGARRLPDTVTLAESGAVRLLASAGGTGFYAFDDWGFWGRQFEESVFGAFVHQRVQGSSYFTPGGRIEGSPSGSNPVSGTAAWSGKVRAYDTQSGAGWTPVSGNARLEVDLGAATVNVDFTDFEAGHADMSWNGLSLRAGAFSHVQHGASIEGAFYGSEHQGAAGTFRRDRLDGVFGAVRN